jgi:hypothetical protein
MIVSLCFFLDIDIFLLHQRPSLRVAHIISLPDDGAHSFLVENPCARDGFYLANPAFTILSCLRLEVKMFLVVTGNKRKKGL